MGDQDFSETHIFGTQKMTRGELGFLLLGLSFLCWSIIEGPSALYGTNYIDTGALFVSVFGFSSIPLTILGLLFVNLDLKGFLKRRRIMATSSAAIFDAINAVGFLLIYFTPWKGIVLAGQLGSFYVGLFIVCALFFIFVALMFTFVLPFAAGAERVLLWAALILSAVYLAIWVESIVYFHLYVQPHLHFLPGANFPAVVYIINYWFGFSAGLLTNYMDYGFITTVWGYRMALAINVIFAYVCLSLSLKKIRKVSGTSISGGLID